jgi:hypothetical protein
MPQFSEHSTLRVWGEQLRNIELTFVEYFLARSLRAGVNKNDELYRSLREPEPTRTNLAAKTKQQEGSDMDTKTRVFCSGPYMLCGNSHKVGKVDTKTLVVGQDAAIAGRLIAKGIAFLEIKWERA